jgi:hypothetical protein
MALFGSSMLEDLKTERDKMVDSSLSISSSMKEDLKNCKI